jgi:hypothetical protein
MLKARWNQIFDGYVMPRPILIALALVLVFLSHVTNAKSGAEEGYAPFAFEKYGPKDTVNEIDSGKVTVSSDRDGGAGIYIRTENATDRPNLIKFTGKKILGSATLRVRYGTSEPLYNMAPDGKFLISLDPGEHLELLIYQDNPFSYSVAELKKSVCTDCSGRKGHRTRILNQIPGLKASLSKGDWEEVLVKLLDFSSNKSDVGITPRSDVGYALNGNDLTYLFERDAMEGSCGLLSAYFSKILSEFGFSSMTVDFGVNVRDSLTHVTTIVLAPNGRYYIFDPTFNATYRTESGRLADVREVLQREDIRFKERKLKRDTYVLWNKRHLLLKSGYLKTRHYDFSACKDKTIDGERYFFCPKMPYGLAMLIENWRDRLKANGYSVEDILKTFLKEGTVFSVGGLVQEHRADLINLLKANGVKIGF